jgi:hypothetical protein
MAVHSGIPQSRGSWEHQRPIHSSNAYARTLPIVTLLCSNRVVRAVAKSCACGPGCWYLGVFHLVMH